MWLVPTGGHWPDDFKTIVLQTARSRQQLLDSLMVLDFDRHSSVFKLVGMGMDTFAAWPICDDFLEVFGDLDSAVQVLEKQMLFAEKYYETGGWSWHTIGPTASAGSARLMGLDEGLWATFERMDMANVTDEDAMRKCWETMMTNGWRSDDGLRSLMSPSFLSLIHISEPTRLLSIS